MDIDTEPFNVDTDIDYETPRIRREAEPKPVQGEMAMSDFNPCKGNQEWQKCPTPGKCAADRYCARATTTGVPTDYTYTGPMISLTPRAATVVNIGELEEVKMARRCLMALHLEVEPCIANDVTKQVEAAFNAIKNQYERFQQ